ncbi:uncharacterized protein LOC130738661 isoform X1 [Lotus japonicus]|uniref:uncharacterized protein LOC130738661 isoform X1 n=1 Tax=Lotus japonicus TaxID=34305 RepID=UPI00258C4B5D|nr:uncharacterized protein LOC130738661 isoform X1 [Lotus japonicus]
MEETKSKLRISEEIPILGGDEALEWIQRLEVVLRGVSEEEKLQASMEALKGRALTWFQWWKRCNSNPSWEGFKIAVVRRFQPSKIQNPFELLLSLKQDETVEDYVKDFEKYVGALREIDPEFVKDTFLKGLKEEIRIEVQSYEFHSLSEIIQNTIFVAQERTGSEFASEAEGNETSEAEATPENVNHDTTAVEVIQKQDLATEGESETRAEEKERVATKTEQERALSDERASSTVAIERFSLKLTHHGGWDFIGEPPSLGFPLMVMGLFQWLPPIPSDHAVRLLHEGGSSEWSRRLASRLLNPYPCRPPDGNLPPPEPPDLSVGCGEVLPLLVGHAEWEGKTHRRLGWRNTERAGVKVWTYNPNGPSPNIRFEELGHTDDWAQISGGINGYCHNEAGYQMTWARKCVSNQPRPCALELGWCRDINASIKARFSETKVVMLGTFIRIVYEKGKRDFNPFTVAWTSLEMVVVFPFFIRSFYENGTRYANIFVARLRQAQVLPVLCDIVEEASLVVFSFPSFNWGIKSQHRRGSNSTHELFSQLLLVANSLELYRVLDFTKYSVVVPHTLGFSIWDFIGTESNWLRWKLVQIRHEIGSGHAIGVYNAIWIHDMAMVMTVVEASSVYKHGVGNISLELLVFEEYLGLLLQRSIDNGKIYFSDSGVWINKPHTALFFQKDQSYRIEWYSVPAFLLHWQLCATPCQPHAFVELDAEFQNWGFLGAEFHILTWRTGELQRGSSTTWLLCYMLWDPGMNRLIGDPLPQTAFKLHGDIDRNV